MFRIGTESAKRGSRLEQVEREWTDTKSKDRKQGDMVRGRGRSCNKRAIRKRILEGSA